MLKLTADYHTHTRFSHGKGDIEDNVQAALRLGLKKIAIADHGYAHMGFGIRKSDLPLMKEKIIILRERYPEIEILLGMEANILDPDGTLDVDDEDLKLLDVLLAGYHFGSAPKGWSGIKFHGLNLIARGGYESAMAKELNTQAFCNAMLRYPVNILTHPGAKGPVDILRVAAVAAQRGVWLEINSHHGFLTVEQIREAAPSGVKFVIDSDAHRPQDVGQCDEGLKRALDAGISTDQLVNFRLE